MFEKFFKINYKTPDSFIKAGKGFWFGLTKGEHGPGSFSADISKPVEINWDGIKEPGMFIGMMHNILKRFWTLNIDYREDGPLLTPEVEKMFSFEITDNVLMRGVIDRIQPLDNGNHELWDYKPYNLNQFSLENDIQMIAYNYWYYRMHGKQPERLAIYNYGKEPPEHMSLVGHRSEKEFVKLITLLKEAQAYVRAVCLGEIPPDGFDHFPQKDAVKGQMRSQLMVNPSICKWCEHTEECNQIEHGELPSTREFYLEKYKAPAKVAPTQPELFAFSAKASAAKVQKQVQKEIARRTEQPLKEFDKKTGLLRIPPKPIRISEQTTPTKYGRCPICNFAMQAGSGGHKKCGSCHAWFDQNGEYLAEETWKSLSTRIKNKRKKRIPDPS